ncbi:tripartite tricarboxylate transporter substrate binding protein [Siccirubricoccus sp. G192]|uniref:tripartite tricarboxylate transporter substrate binding protein n=1 Tax=Siccirubricoccus sp. G192 TaxID=2849651 RepID=UPI001C2C7220|nr:tripartite tricarboxylate transporter substrate binding protein [Siccirubricoccus sp. G192]MBV1799808.1 tripartite tricarboxylate transporter substrate binding protein [Siccirubricoccus sp. G192]
MSLTRRGALGAGLAALAAPALAQNAGFPNRPLELVVGFAPGGGTDVTARTFARFLEPRLGQPVVVQNRPGASGELAWAYVARARPDGHVIGITNMPSFVTIPIERSAAQYRLEDFAYIGNLVTDPSGLVVVAESPIRDMQDLIARARRDPEGVTVSTSGVGTDDHLMLVLIEQAMGVRLTPVHFNGAAPQKNALLGRQVQAAAINVGEVMPASEGLRMLAQAGAQRSRLAPDVPTLTEQGVAAVMQSERGIITAAGTPPGAVAKLREATAAVAQDPGIPPRHRGAIHRTGL